jgi:hypothetical protein
MVAIALHEEVHDGPRLFSTWSRTIWFWTAVAALICTGGLLVCPSAVELWRTGHTNVHWSRFVVAISCLSSAAVLGMVRGIDRVLDLVEERVKYLWKKS